MEIIDIRQVCRSPIQGQEWKIYLVGIVMPNNSFTKLEFVIV